jgi:hypothetical protein
VPVLVTVTSYLRLHRDEVVFVRLHGNTVLLRFVSMKPVRLPVDDLTAEAREWLLPSMAPREIPLPDETLEDDESTPRRREEAR